MVWCQTSGNSLISIEGRVVPVKVQYTLSVDMHTRTDAFSARSTGELLYEKLAVTREKERGELFDRCRIIL